MDARVKLLTLFVLSLTVFLVTTWQGVGVIALLVLGCMLLGHLPAGRVAKFSIPLLILLLFIVLCNSLTFDVAAAPKAEGSVAGLLAGLEPIALWGNFGISLLGFMTALMYSARILVVFVAGYVLAFSTTAEALTAAFSSLLSPLRHLRVPVDDVALMLSLALRFIPLMAAEAGQLRRAQSARGAEFAQGGAWRRIASWQVVLVPLVVAMFRRASVLALAMEARCYGVGNRSSLQEESLAGGQIVFLILCVAACGACIALL